MMHPWNSTLFDATVAGPVSRSRLIRSVLAHAQPHHARPLAASSLSLPEMTMPSYLDMTYQENIEHERSYPAKKGRGIADGAPTSEFQENEGQANNAPFYQRAQRIGTTTANAYSINAMHPHLLTNSRSVTALYEPAICYIKA